MRYIIAICSIILVAIFAVVLILSQLTPHSDSKKTTNKPAIITLADYASDDSSVTLTTQGRLLGDEDRTAIRVTITPSERRLQVLKTYDETVVSSHTYPNTPVAYRNFLQGLERLSFGKSRKVKTTDYHGVCPLGNRYIYDLTNNGNSVENVWSDTCSTGDGTATGSVATIRQLFQLQIPGYSKQTNDIIL